MLLAYRCCSVSKLFKVALYMLRCGIGCTGRYMYKGGKLVPTSLDLYLALEYCDQGAQWLPCWQTALQCSFDPAGSCAGYG